MTISTSTSTPLTVTPGSLPEGDDQALLTLSEAATILRVPVNTMRWWRQQGTGPVFFKVGRRLVTTTGDLRRWLDEQRQRGDTMDTHTSRATMSGSDRF